MKLTVNGRTHEGTPTEIVTEMKSYAFGGDDLTIDAFVAQTAQMVLDNPETVSGADDDALCNSLVDAMLEQGAAVRAA